MKQAILFSGDRHSGYVFKIGEGMFTPVKVSSKCRAIEIMEERGYEVVE